MVKLIFSLFAALSSFAILAQDVVIINHTAPASATRYEELSVAMEVRNQGIAKAELVWIMAYLSVDDILDPNTDFVAGTQFSYSIPANTTIQVDLSPRFIHIPSGSYYLILAVDPTNQLAETDESNNTVVVPGFTVNDANIDFVISTLTPAQSSVNAGSMLQGSLTINNLGSSKFLSPVFTTFYLSKDQLIDASDAFAGHIASYLLNSSNVVTFEVQIADLAPGEYYLLAKVDGSINSNDLNYNRAEETNESNNVFAKPITIIEGNIDLTGVNNFYVSYYQSNYSYPVFTVDGQLTVQNLGTTPSGNFTISYYISSNTMAEYDDFYLGKDVIEGGLEPGASRSVYYHSMFYQPPPTEGYYYLVAVINEFREKQETNYTNNVVHSTPFYIHAPVFASVDLVNFIVTEPITIAHNSLPLLLHFENNSSQTYNNQEWIYVNLVDPQGHGIDVPNDWLYQYVPAGQNSMVPFSVSVLEPLENGVYYLTVGNSRGAVTIPVPVGDPYRLNGTVVTADDIPVSKGRLFLYQKDGQDLLIGKSVILDGGNSFTFNVKQGDYTLYFIPDTSERHLYVPTIFNKAILPQDADFLNVTGDLTVSHEVLSIPSLPSGDKTISGSVSVPDISSGRQDPPINDIPIFLLDDQDNIVAITYTDEDGNFEFLNIPAESYGVLVSGTDSDLFLSEKISIDVTTYNSFIKIIFEENGITYQTRKVQNLILSPITPMKYGDALFTISYSSDADLPVVIKSSNPSVAVIEDGQMRILNAGVTIITISQTETAEFAAVSAQQELIVEKADQILTFPELQPKLLHDGPFELDVSSSMDLPVTFSSTNPDVATVEGKIVTLHNAGTSEIIASQAGNNNVHAASSVTRTLVVNTVTSVEQKVIFQVYPNPTPGLVNISGISQIDYVELTNAIGNTIALGSETTIDLSAYPSGLYFLKIVSGNKVERVRLVRQ